MDDSETKDEKGGENNDVLDVDSLDSFPSLPTTGSQKSADDIEKENKQKNTCIDTCDDDLAKGTSTVPTGELNTAGVNQLKVDTPVDTDGVKGEYVPDMHEDDVKDGDDAVGGVANDDVSIAEDDDDTSAVTVMSEAGSKRTDSPGIGPPTTRPQSYSLDPLKLDASRLG